LFNTRLSGPVFWARSSRELKNEVALYTIKVYMIPMAEKRKPTYDLDAFKATFATVDKL
jgi:hypothetical protein